MKSAKVPLLVLGALSLGFSSFLVWSSLTLPDRVATHFGVRGYPDGWMSRSSAVAVMGGFGLGLPLLVVVMAFGLRFIPASLINIPNREYWLSEEQRESTFAFMTGLLVWLSCLLVCFMAALHWLTIRANAGLPVQLPMGPFWTILGGFIAGVAVWMGVMFWHFRKR